MKRLTAAIMMLFAAGCATIERAATAKETFVVCRAVDVATTLYIVGHGGTELNPIMAPLVHNPALFIGVQAVVVMFAWSWWDRLTPTERGVVNVVNCVPGIHNLGQLSPWP